MHGYTEVPLDEDGELAAAASYGGQYSDSLGYGPIFDEFPEELQYEGYPPEWGALSQFRRDGRTIHH